MAVRTLPASAVVGTGGPPTQPYWHFAVCPLLLVEEWWKVSSLLSLSDNTQSTDGSFLLVSKESKKVVWKISCLFTPAKLARAEDYIVSASVWLEWSVARPHLFALFLGKQTSCHFIFLWLLVILHLRLPQHLALFLVTQSRPTLCEPMDYSPPGSSVLGDSPGKNTGVGCHALLQGIIPTQASNPGLPHCRQILCGLSKPPGKPTRLRRNLTQELSWDLPYCRQVLCQLSLQGSLTSAPYQEEQRPREPPPCCPSNPDGHVRQAGHLLPTFQRHSRLDYSVPSRLFSYKTEGLQGMGWLHLGRKRRPWGEIFMGNIFVRWLYVPHSSIDECLRSRYFTKHLVKMWDQWNPTESRRDVFSPQLLQKAKWGSAHHWWLWPKEFISKVALDTQHGTSGP